MENLESAESKSQNELVDCRVRIIILFIPEKIKYVQICKRARNVHLKIYDAHEMYVRITYCLNEQMIFDFRLLNIHVILHFSISFYLLFVLCKLFFHKYEKLVYQNMFALSKDIQFSIFFLNRRYVIICFFCYTSK